ncbi:hypothetical protein EV401DRAFT_890502 [Pisolithus croceorrhizus]|nr:hypothetical protein EV401DRAFT_890502 [Pisolithus croceorrhizus]
MALELAIRFWEQSPSRLASYDHTSFETVGCWPRGAHRHIGLQACPRRVHTYIYSVIRQTQRVSVPGLSMADTATTTLYVTSPVGPIVVSLVLSGVLYGCALVQTYVYYKLFPKDDWKLRALVAFEMAFQTVQLILLFLGVWQTVVITYSRSQITSSLVNTTVVGMIIGAPSAFCVQAFFIFRLHSFSRRKPLPVFCSILITIQLAFTLTVGASSSEVVAFQKWQGFIVSTLFIAICVDTTIAASMSYYLKGSKTGLRR